MQMSNQAEQQFNLNKMLLSVIAVFLCYRVFSNIPESWLLMPAARSSGFYPTMRHTYVGTGLFLLLEMLVLLWVYRPLGPLFAYKSEAEMGSHPHLWNIFAGAAYGVIGAAVSTPFLSSNHTRVIINAVFAGPFPVDAQSVGYFVLFSLVLPSATTMVFYGSILRTLLNYARPSVSILASTVLLAYLWPIFMSFIVALIFGAVTGITYWRKGLLSAMIANVVMSALGIIYAHWYIWR